MYRDSYNRPQSGLMRFLMALSASFPVGRFFGVRVRMYWVALVLVPILLYAQRARWDPTTGGPIADALITTFLLYLIVWSHEMGHIAAGWRFGIPSHLITLSPMGGLAHMETFPGTPRQDAIVSLAGPATHLLWLAAIAGPYFLIDHGGYGRAGWFMDPVGQPLLFVLGLLWHLNLVLMLFNLLPFFPMDGGRSLRAFMAMRMSPWKATVIACRVGQVAAVGFVLWGLFTPDLWGTILFVIGISNFFACMRELKMLQYVPNPYDQPGAVSLDPWAADPDAWKHGGAEPSTAGPTKSQLKTIAKQDKAREKAAQEAAELDRQMDEVLARIGEVGMSGLTARERKILERASEARRKR